MKKYLWMIIVCLIVVSLLVVCRMNIISVSPYAQGTVVFEHVDKSICSDVCLEHMRQITDIFNNKFLYSGLPSCGFSEDVSIKIDNYTFCIACDNCGVVYLLEKDKYFDLSDDENKIIRDILISYGFYFPCV